MKKNLIPISVVTSCCIYILSGCDIPKHSIRQENKSVPDRYILSANTDSTNIFQINYRDYFKDDYLVSLIDTALKNNQELNLFLQEIEILKNESIARKGEYLPFVSAGGASGVEKPGRYTRDGAVEEQLKIRENKPFPEPLGDFQVRALATWEVDIWKKLRNSQKSAVKRYLAGIEGKNFLRTMLVSEIASSYYELLSLDNMLEIINENIEIQEKALRVVQQQKQAAKVTQLAVNRFEAQLLNTQNRQYEIKQKIVETENRINFLTARYPAPIVRTHQQVIDISVDSIYPGIPSQLLTNRPDVRKAELELEAAKLNVKAVKANFYPSLRIQAGVGFQAFNPSFLLNPESALLNLAGDLMAPLINKKAIKAAYSSATAKQLQAIINYEQSLLNAYVDVINQLAKVDNYTKSLETKSEEVKILQQSINTANLLFNSARADYSEVLLTQREALDAKLELVEIKSKQLSGKVNIYRALGGG